MSELDFFRIDDHFDDTERAIADAIQLFVKRDAHPLWVDAYEMGYFPQQLIPAIADLGLLGMTLPAEFGGSDASYMAYGLACRELERGDSALRSFVSVQSSLSMFAIHRFGSEEQRQRYLPPMAKGQCLGCFGLTEADAGSDPNSMHTNAKKTAAGWVLNGSKLWITNAPLADVAIVWAKTDEGIQGFLVDKDTPGFTVALIKHKLSLRASATGELSLNDCVVPESQRLPGTSVGLKAALTCLDEARFGVAWGCLGAALDCYDVALQYTLEREQFGRPIASFQLVQSELADIMTQLCGAQLMNVHAARLKQHQQLTPAMTSLIKRNACRVALDTARRCRTLLGANGISLEYRIMRHMNNLESVITYEGTDFIHTLALGKALTGINAFTNL